MTSSRDSRLCLPADCPPSPSGDWGVAELHCHTTASDGTVSPEHLVEIAEHVGLDVLAVTDHDTMTGALRARDYALRVGARVEVVVGMEVTTRRQDHIVGLFLERPPEIFRSVDDTVDAIHAQGGLAIVAHPFLGLPSSISAGRLRKALERCRFDGIEAENPYMRKGARERFQRFMQDEHDRIGAVVGSSDAHFGDLAQAVSLFEGRTAADLRRAIATQAVTPAIGRVRYAAPSLSARLQNQYRSLVRLPITRGVLLWRQWRGD